MRKKLFYCLAVVCSLLSGGAWGQGGIPTFDFGTVTALADQLKQMGDDYREFQAQTKALTSGLTNSLNISNVNPMQEIGGAAKDVMQQIGNNYGFNGATTPTDLTKQLENAGTIIQSITTFNGKQLQGLQNDSARIDRLVEQSKNAAGSLEAQQAGNQINAELAQQVQAQRAEAMAQSQVQNTWLLQQQQKEAAKASLTQSFLGKSTQAPDVKTLHQQFSGK